jgi:hypothetical protein
MIRPAFSLTPALPQTSSDLPTEPFRKLPRLSDWMVSIRSPEILCLPHSSGLVD